jgi:hypothetical protein
MKIKNNKPQKNCKIKLTNKNEKISNSNNNEISKKIFFIYKTFKQSIITKEEEEEWIKEKEKSFLASKRNKDEYRRQRNELLKKYKGKFIAFSNGEVKVVL